MKRDIFTNTSTGTLRMLSGEYPSRYGLISYETPSFIPDPLGDYPTLTMRTLGAVNRASMAVARLSELGERLPNPDLMRRQALRREAQSTSALEGTYERLETVLAQDYEPGGSTVELNATMREILNYVDAANCGIDSMRDSRPITLPLIRELQQILVHGTASDNPQAGEIRNSQVFIGSPTRKIEDARFVPMPPGHDLNIAVQQLIDWWNARTEPGLAMLDMAMFHYQFETLHPFTDGNGRIGRLLILLQMMSRGLLRQPLLSVSSWFEQQRGEYQDALFGVSTRGDWDTWILLFCQGVEEASEDALARTNRLLFIREQYRELVTAHGYGTTVMETGMLFIGHPFLTPAQLQRHIPRSTTALRSALKRLESLGIIEKSGREYVAPDVLDAVTSPQGTPIDVDAPLIAQGPRA